jgi:hypothetical protein
MAGALIASLAAAFVVERKQLTALSQQNESLRSSKEEADRLEAENGELAKFRKDFFGEGNPLRKVTGFRIAKRTTLAEDKIRLGIQVVANGAIMPLEIWRVGNDWKVDMR